MRPLAPSVSRLPEVAGRRVAVVGNARSLLAATHGGEIDACEVVIRMNRGLPVAPASQGSRTDILAFSVFRLVAATHTRFEASSYLWMSPRERETALPDHPLPAATRFYDVARWEALRQQLGARPSVGAMVLDLLRHSAPAAVTIFGFDFKRSRSVYQRTQNIGPHDYMAEEAFCTELVRAQGWHFVADFESA